MEVTTSKLILFSKYPLGLKKTILYYPLYSKSKVKSILSEFTNTYEAGVRIS